MSIDLLIKGLEVVVLPLLAVVLPWLLQRYLKQKALREGLDQILGLAIGYAEQWAHKRAKLHDRPGSETKLAVAADKAFELLADHKLPQLGAEKLVGLLEAKLGAAKVAK